MTFSPSAQAIIDRKGAPPPKPTHPCLHCRSRCSTAYHFCFGCNEVLKRNPTLFNRYHDARTHPRLDVEPVVRQCLEFLKENS